MYYLLKVALFFLPFLINVTLVIFIYYFCIKTRFCVFGELSMNM